jgi:hypothetical protein
MKFSRRDFIHAGCAVAAASLIPDPAEAFWHGSAVNNLLAARAQVNAFTGEPWAFQNVVKNAGSPGGGTGWQAQSNDDGYPNGPVTISFSSIINLDATLLNPSTVWVMSWQGKGGLLIDTGGSVGLTITVATGTNVSPSSLPSHQSPNVFVSGTDCYFEFTFDSGASQLHFQFTNNFTYDGTMRNLQIYRKSDQVGSSPSGTFMPEFIAMMKSLNPKVLRTMDWCQTNNSNLTRFAYRNASTALSYSNSRIHVAALYGGTTGGSTTAYTCSNPSGSGAGAYVDGETVQVIFNAANTGSAPTLNVGARGAVEIQTDYAAGLTSGNIQINAFATLVYDAWLNVWLTTFGQPTNNNFGGGLGAGVPIETVVQLCNQLNCNLHYCIPHLYDNASVTSVVQYVRDNLNSNLTAHFEYSNEVWNFVMHQTFVAQARGAFLGFPNSSARQVDGYYGLRTKQVMDLVTAAWSPRSTATLVRVMAVWMNDADPTNQSKAHRMNGADLDTTLGYTNYNSKIGVSYNVGSPTFSRPIDVCDAIAYAPYFAGPVLGGNSGDLSGLSTTDVGLLQAAADNYASGVPAQMTAALAWVDNDIRKGVTGAQTVTVASDVFTVVTAPGNGTEIAFYTVATPFSIPGKTYSDIFYVVNSGVGGAGKFQIAASFGGSAITGISGGSGTQYVGQLGTETLLRNKNFYYATTNTRSFGWAQVAASYNGARPGGASNLNIECYEGGLENLAPTVAQCNAAAGGTLTGSTYGGFTGRISVMLEAYKNSALGQQLAIDYLTDVVTVSNAASVNTVVPSWYGLNATNGFPSQWSLTPGDSFSTPYQTFNGFAAYNH